MHMQEKATISTKPSTLSLSAILKKSLPEISLVIKTIQRNMFSTKDYKKKEV